MNVTTTLDGVTRTVAVRHEAVQRHIAETGITYDQAARCEALWVLGSELIQEEIDRSGIEAGENLANGLESVVLEQTAKVLGL